MFRAVTQRISSSDTGITLKAWLLPVVMLWPWTVHAEDSRPPFRINHQVIRYQGPLSAAPVARLLEAVQGLTVRELVITSSGGEVAAGIRLGSWVSSRQVDVRVVDYCLSSCANYVFTAGRRKRIDPGAVVAWHGNYHHLRATGLWQDDIPLRMRRTGEDEATARRHVLAQVEELVSREQDFFARIGVDQRLCWIGKRPPYDVPDYFFLTARDMARFGVTGIELPTAYADVDVSGFAVDIRLIRLDGCAGGVLRPTPMPSVLQRPRPVIPDRQ